MRILITLFLVFVSVNSYAGVGGGGVGPRPMDFFRSKADWVKTIKVKGDTISFFYKSFEEEALTIETLESQDISPMYLKALNDSSIENGQWISVPLAE